MATNSQSEVNHHVVHFELIIMLYILIKIDDILKQGEVEFCRHAKNFTFYTKLNSVVFLPA
jgi:hypothetical protein